MRPSLSVRALAVVTGALILLLVALAAVQYRWSTRVAAADSQREREHLDAAASLFAAEFNAAIEQVVAFLQRDAWTAMQSGSAVPQRPKLIADIYSVHIRENGEFEAKRTGPDGRFVPVARPESLPVRHCAPLAIQKPLAVVTPVYEIDASEVRAKADVRVVRVRRPLGRCFVGLLDESWIKGTMIPDLIRRTFGEIAMREYDFSVVARNNARDVVYGTPGRTDLTKAFFSITPRPPAAAGGSAPPEPGRANVLVFQRTETVISSGTPAVAGLFGAGVWDLGVARKGEPLDSAFRRKRWRDLALSLAVELSLVVAILLLVASARRMQRVADQRMRFVAGVSHELRTPLSAIAMLARNQADGLVTAPDKVKQYGQLMHQQSRRLNEMVEQTLQYAGIHSGLRKPGADQVDLGKLVREAVEHRRESLSRGGSVVEVSIDPEPLTVAGDANLLRTAIDNLLSNAEKYAGGGTIRVCAVRSEAEKEVRISVEDQGPGIEHSDQAQIFEPFCRGRAAVEAQIPGSGLGLSLVRSAAEAHHGSVSLASVPGRGSTFTVHLPV